MPTLSDAKNLSDKKREEKSRAAVADNVGNNPGVIDTDGIRRVSLENISPRTRTISDTLLVFNPLVGITPDHSHPGSDISGDEAMQHRRASSDVRSRDIAEIAESVAARGRSRSPNPFSKDRNKLEHTPSQKRSTFKSKREILSKSFNDLRGTFTRKPDEEGSAAPSKLRETDKVSESADDSAGSGTEQRDKARDKSPAKDEILVTSNSVKMTKDGPTRIGRRRGDSILDKLGGGEAADRQRKFEKEFSAVAPGELYVNDFIAALRKRGRYSQGRMYISDKSVCFHSVLLKHAVSIKYTEITKIARKKQAGIPQSIKIFRKEGKPVMFASLIRRDAVVREIADLWLAVNEGKTEEDLLEINDNEDTDGEAVLATGCGCGNEHLSRQMMNIVVNKPVDELFHMLAAPDGFYRDFVVDKCGYKEFTVGAWEDLPDQPGVRKRDLTFITPLAKNSFGPTEAPVEMEQYLLVDIPGERYVMALDSYTPKMPYGDNMVTKYRWCFSKESDHTARYRITCEIAFRKSIFGPIKKVIVASTTPMMEAQITKLREAVIDAAGGLAEDTAELLEAEDDVKSKALADSESVSWQDWLEDLFEDVNIRQVLLIFFAAVVVAQLVMVQRELHSLQMEISELTKAMKDSAVYDE